MSTQKKKILALTISESKQDRTWNRETMEEALNGAIDALWPDGDHPFLSQAAGQRWIVQAAVRSFCDMIRRDHHVNMPPKVWQREPRFQHCKN
jgi:hypothetical protein